MWLPESIYEKIPHFWFLAGVVFISAALYLGVYFDLADWYLALGFICCGAGIGIFATRIRYRAKSNDYKPTERVED